MSFDPKKIKFDPKPPVKGRKTDAIALPPVKKTKIDPAKIKGL